MKIQITKTIGFNEVDPHHQLRLKPLFNCLQAAAATHSHQVGCGTADLLKQGYAWVLNKVGLSINRLPELDEEIDIVTWHKGTRGFRSYRDYRITRKDELLVSATSLWLFIDVLKKKIIQPPAEISTRYTYETENATELDLDHWRPTKTFQPQHTATITTRPSDFDPLGHANNAAYLDYLEVLLAKRIGEKKDLQNLMIQYLNEAPSNLPSVTADLGRCNEGYLFRISSNDTVNAVGLLKIA
jgi:medium-chain acyl-[acyl-carrier-protein] hydrolase